MHQPTPPIEAPSIEVVYEPDPGSLAGFLASLPEKVDELLLAANWRPSLE